MFYSFASQAERRAFGGSDFLEIQFCKLPPETKPEKAAALDSITHWQDDSFYISGDDMDLFLKEYGGIFDCGMYYNMETGTIDPYGPNYYRPELTEKIIERILTGKPADYQKLLAWLNAAKKYNGFYILGV